MAANKSVIAINISVFLLMIGVGLIVALLPQRIMTLTGSVADVGMLASAFAVPNVLLQIPIGNLSDRFGYKSFLVGGYFLCALTGFLYFFADTQNFYFGGRILQGIAEVPIWALAPALLSVQYAAEKGKFMGLYNASLHCGLTLGGLVSIVIFGICQGNEPFLLFALLSIAGGVIIILFVDDPGKRSIGKATHIDLRGVWLLLSNSKNLLIFSGITLYGAGYGIFITIIPAFLINSKHADRTSIGAVFAFFYITLGLSQFFAGKWSDRKGRKTAMIMGLLLAASGTAFFHICKYPYYNVFLGMAGFGLGVFCVSSMAFLNDHASMSLKGTISGAFYFSWGAGYFLGPMIIGRVGALMNFHVGFLLFSGLLMAQLVAIGTGLTENRSPISHKK